MSTAPHQIEAERRAEQSDLPVPDRFRFKRSKEKVLRFSMKAVRRLVVMAAVVGVVSAYGAASASAVVFSPSGSTVHSGTLTWKLNGGSPVTCTFTGQGNVTGSYILSQQIGGPCSSSSSATGGYTLRAFSPTSVGLAGGLGVPQTPYGNSMNIIPVAVPWTNGTASTPSRITFNNTLVGSIPGSGQQVTWTGTLNVTTSAGGLVTVN